MQHIIFYKNVIQCIHKITTFTDIVYTYQIKCKNVFTMLCVISTMFWFLSLDFPKEIEMKII